MAKPHFTSDAERFAWQAWKTLKLSPPVDIELVAKRLGIDLHHRQFVPEIDGFYIRMPDGQPVIAVNNSYTKPPSRQRFTAAHEIGHHLLSLRIPTGRKLTFFDCATTNRSMVEKACDRFAALLLMPEDIIRQWFEELAANPEHRVVILAERFQVSPSAIRVRLKELDLPYQTYSYRRR